MKNIFIEETLKEFDKRWSSGWQYKYNNRDGNSPFEKDDIKIFISQKLEEAMLMKEEEIDSDVFVKTKPEKSYKAKVVKSDDEKYPEVKPICEFCFSLYGKLLPYDHLQKEME